MSYNLYLQQYNFPKELNVKAVTFGEKVTLEFDLPSNKISDKIKNDLQNLDFKKGDQSIVSLKKKTRSTFEIKGGNSFEIKVKSLLFILNNYIVNDNPIFKAEFIPIPSDISASIPEIPPKYTDITKYQCKSKKEFNKSLTATLTTEQIYLLVSMYNPDEVRNLVGLIQDENHDPQIFNLKMPNPVDVLIQYIGFDKYQISFGGKDYKLIHDTIIDKALKTFESTECILATFTETDPVDTEELKHILNNPNVVSIPDENTVEADSAITYVEIFIPLLNDQKFNDVKSKLEEYYKKIQLAVCKKCTLFFSPNSDDPCYKLFHKGEQIPFESGEMEEMCDDEEEPYLLVNYTCCGEVPKDEIPMNCGKEENGKHEMDEKTGIISKLEIKRAKPGQIKQKELE